MEGKIREKEKNSAVVMEFTEINENNTRNKDVIR